MKSKKSIFITIVLIFIVIGVIHFSARAKSYKNTVCINSFCVNVEIADTFDERMTGLMFRKELGDKEGMFFIFEKEDKHSFWMKNTLISLDMIWISKNQEVVYVQENALPCKKDPCPSYFPDKEAKYVLEVNSGLVAKNRLKIGDKVKLYLKAED